MCSASRNHSLKDLEDIQIVHHHQSENKLQPLAVGVVGLVLDVKLKRNAFRHTVEKDLHQKVEELRMYESVFESVFFF